MKLAANEGVVVPSFDEGCLILKDDKGRGYRLEWPADRRDGAKPDRRRALPAGKYTLVTYRIAQRDGAGVEWFISGTAAQLRGIVVRAGGQETVKVEPAIRITTSARSTAGETRVQAGISGEAGCGLSIYRNGQRIPLAYRIDDSAGKKIAGGPMQYG